MEGNQNAVFTFNKRNFGNIRFNPKMTNMLWTITADGKIAAFRSVDFANLPKQDGSTHIFRMHVSTERLTSAQEAREFLQI